MELFKRLIFWGFVIFVLFLFVWALFIPKSEISQKINEAMESQSRQADLAFRGVTVSEIVNGIKYWEIKADSSDINKDKSTAQLMNSRGTFYDNGKPGLKFISPEIIWKINKKEIEMKQPFGFDAKSEKNAEKILKDPRQNVFSLPQADGSGYYFKAEKLLWKLRDGKITCRGDIWVRRGEITGKADILSSDVSFSHIFLGGSPFINLYSPEPVKIEAMYFEVDGQRDILSARGDVVISSKDTLISAPELIYNQKTESMVLKNKVVISYKDNTAAGNTAFYDVRKMRIELKDNVTLKQAGNSLTGDRIVYSLKTNHFKISGKSRAVIKESKIKEQAK